MTASYTHLVVSRDDAIKCLLKGGVGILPTDTVYGLVARALDPAAVTRLYALKQRERKPGTLIAADISQLRQLGVLEVPLQHILRYWPGPLSAVLPIDQQFSYLHQGLGDIAMRIVADEDVKAILLHTGPLLTSSANSPGAPGSVNLEEAWNYFQTNVDFYVDGGDRASQPPSTIVKPTTDGTLQLIRQGSVVVDKK
jgi:L-threonylcarbamoyladenylate synthase